MNSNKIFQQSTILKSLIIMLAASLASCAPLTRSQSTIRRTYTYVYREPGRQVVTTSSGGGDPQSAAAPVAPVAPSRSAPLPALPPSPSVSRPFPPVRNYFFAIPPPLPPFSRFHFHGDQPQPIIPGSFFRAPLMPPQAPPPPAHRFSQAGGRPRFVPRRPSVAPTTVHAPAQPAPAPLPSSSSSSSSVLASSSSESLTNPVLSPSSVLSTSSGSSSSATNSLRSPSSSRPVASPATAGRQSYRARPAAPASVAAAPRPRPPPDTLGPVSAPESPSAADVDIGFDVPSNSDSSSLAGPVVPDPGPRPAASSPVAAVAPAASPTAPAGEPPGFVSS